MSNSYLGAKVKLNICFDKYLLLYLGNNHYIGRNRIMTNFQKDIIVRSFEGLERYVCMYGATCIRPRCACAHPNMSGSEVKHPRWCLFGPMGLCKEIGCPFNHFRTQIEFVNYRMRDEKWAWNNVDLVHQYSYKLEKDTLTIAVATNH